MKDLEIRPARLLDAGVLGEIMGAAQDCQAWLPRIYTRAEQIQHCDQMIASDWVSVAHYNSEIVGFVALEGTYIHSLYLHPDAQRKGFGGCLIDASKRRSNHLRLNSYQRNLAANRFYHAVGFVEVVRGDGRGNDVGLPDIEFEWRKEADA